MMSSWVRAIIAAKTIAPAHVHLRLASIFARRDVRVRTNHAIRRALHPFRPRGISPLLWSRATLSRVQVLQTDVVASWPDLMHSSAIHAFVRRQVHAVYATLSAMAGRQG